MRTSLTLCAAVALSTIGLGLAGCQSPNNDRNAAANVNGVGAGGTTDTYGTSTNARYQSTGNVGTGLGHEAPAITPAPDSRLYGQQQTTGSTVYGGTGGATAGAPAGGSGSVSTGGGGVQGSNTTGNESGAGVRTSTIPAGTTPPNAGVTGGQGQNR